jgi:inosine-uridine nucleoside N-ribohydrolase
VAILFAAWHLELLGVTTVHANNTLENTTRNALAILELAGLDVPLGNQCPYGVAIGVAGLILSFHAFAAPS